jgi:hypothetical protein
MENTDLLLNTAREIMTRELSSKPVLHKGSLAYSQLRDIFHHNCIEDMDITSLASDIATDHRRTKLPIKTLPLFQKARKYGSSEI